MKKLNKVLAIAAFMTFLLSVICVNASANSIEDIEDIGTSLMNTLLERQFTSFMDGSVCDTSDIMTDSESNEFYNYFLEWESRRLAALGEAWIKDKYDLSLTETNGNTLKFTNSVSYWTVNSSELGNYGIEYEITIGKTGKDYYITSIDTTDDDEFEDLLEFTIKKESGRKNSKTRTISEYVDKLVDNSRKTKAALDSMARNEKNVVKEDTIEKDAVKEENSIMPLSTAYSYNGDRGKSYAEQYVTSPNPCFYTASNDCTNFVSQCIWAAYGGWSYGDSKATMETNIRNKKRMQSSSSASNWFAGSGGGGAPWEEVPKLWDFLNTSNSTGPRATKYNNNGIYTNITPSSINIGQVLQVRRGSSGDYGHSVYVIGGEFYGTYYDIEVAQHTSNKIRKLKNLIDTWGGESDCYMRQLKFQTAYFDR